MFSKILIANRGEIAIRIIRACREMGIYTVAVFSEADRESLHVSLADESYCIGGALSKDSYMNMNAVLSAAMATKSEAIHPGYGFLSENSEFAKLCAEKGIVFIGPDAGTISRMGDKDAARRTMSSAGVPVLPGSDLLESLSQAKEAAERIGFPIVIKARSGGGGRGIRVVASMDELEQNYNNAILEAEAAFGDGTVYMEKYLSPVKHIEMQLIADHFGNVVCLGERDCSIQRKKQKLIEESPASIMPEDTRKRMIDVSIRAGAAVGYRGVGTIEYLYDKDGNFYFMEMNTRLQVEHPVTEMVTLVDLVKWQIRVASEMKLGFTQEEIKVSGHAIECRINAEDPYRDFKPSCGKIEMLHIPNGPWVRFDTAVYQGYTIPPFYDSMIGKLIVYAKTRDEAIRKMKAALCELIIEGVVHNAPFQADVLSAEEFVNSSYTTDFLEVNK
ncbi:MAG: acetyl-CoA carboxylase biotin carboxylase subunit [Oscillospiraceae bacterium]|jgi:acetyl-CoA carboxylase biotin carboxylase subunit|nr:acetyl-CoA carboxylase biotin carboxylase subunit [Oscillospiraceae bacterium]